MFVWYRTGLTLINERNNILSSAVLLNAPAALFLISSLIHQFVLHSYSGIIGLLTQSFFMPTVFISSEIFGLISGKSMPAGVCSTGGLETDIISFILLIGSFIVGVIVGEIRKNRPSV